MKTTYRWLKELVPGTPLDADSVAERFTMSGTEVEGVERAGDDWMIELAVTSNRVDCLGALGCARELAVVTGQALVLPKIAGEGSGDPVSDRARVTVDDPKGCPRYTALVVRGVKIGPSPAWLRSRLEAIGLRPVNNVVDVTNWVMFEMNQPIHAFDLAKVGGRHIVVRRARAGEKITAINGKEYALAPDMLLIADEARPLAIAGVMGGLDSEISSATTDLLIETAAFEKLTVRATSRKLGLVSDSSYRFERGLDPHGIPAAARRCAQLVLDVAGGTLCRGMIDVCAPLPERKKIDFRYAQLRRITGVDVAWERSKGILLALGCEVEGSPEKTVRVTAPTWRADLEREIDLVEEIIRVEGLARVPLGTSMKVFPAKEPRPERIKDQLRRRLVGAGFNETLTTSFVSEDEARTCFFADLAPIVIRNAMRADENALRQSLLPSLLRVRKTNQDHGNAGVHLAEITVVYLARSKKEIPEHLPILGLLIDGGYRDARGVIESLVQSLRAGSVDFRALGGRGSALLEESGGATVTLGGAELGFVGRPKAAVLARYDLKSAPVYAELRLDALFAAAKDDVRFAAFSRLPAVARDLAIVVDEGVAWGEIEKKIRALGLAQLEALTFNEEYRGKQVPPGKKSLFFSLVYRAMDRTLTNEEVDAAQARVVEALASAVGAQVRA